VRAVEQERTVEQHLVSIHSRPIDRLQRGELFDESV